MRASSNASSAGTESCWSMKWATPAARAPGTSVSPRDSRVSASFALSRRNGTPWARASRAVNSTLAPPTVNASAPTAAPPMKSRRLIISYLPRAWRLLGPLPYDLGSCPRHCSRVGILQFIRGERSDHSLLGSPVKIGERTSLNLGGHGFVGLVHGIPAKRGNHSLHDSFVFLRSPLVHAVGREFA